MECRPGQTGPQEREFFIDNLLVRIHFIIAMVKWTGLAPRELEFPFPGSLISRNQVPLLLFITLGKDLDDTREALHCRPADLVLVNFSPISMHM